MQGFRVGRLRNYAVCLWRLSGEAIECKEGAANLKQIDDHIPLAAVANELVREIVDETVINGQVSVLD